MLLRLLAPEKALGLDNWPSGTGASFLSEEQMRLGYWLGSLLCVSFVASRLLVDNTKDIRPINSCASRLIHRLLLSNLENGVEIDVLFQFITILTVGT